MLRIVDEKTGAVQSECSLEEFLEANGESEDICVIAACLLVGERHVEDFGAGGIVRIERVW